jgi:hypothetical protein
MAGFLGQQCQQQQLQVGRAQLASGPKATPACAAGSKAFAEMMAEAEEAAGMTAMAGGVMMFVAMRAVVLMMEKAHDDSSSQS